MDIKIENLGKDYGVQRAVDNISFEVRTGEILGFLGPNGAGKTTTMKMITQYLKPDRGIIKIGGKEIPGTDMKNHIGYLPEHNPLYDEMPVMDYLAYCASLQKVPQKEIPSRIREMVKVCGLNDEKHKKINELSKGYRQRVGLAQAMIHDPEVLILDEPTTGLDPNQIVEIRALIKRLGKEKTVILSTHILPEVEATCDRILIINKGKIVADGTAATLRQQAQGKQVLQVRIEEGEPSSVMAALMRIPGIEEVRQLNAASPVFVVHGQSEQKNNAAVFQACVQHNWVLTEMTPMETKLEDIFRDLTMN